MKKSIVLTRRWRNITGFTLVEVLLAISLSAVVLTSLTMMFKVSVESWQNNDEDNETIHAVRVIADDIVSDVQEMMYISEWEIDYQGFPNKDRIKFVHDDYTFSEYVFESASQCYTLNSTNDLRTNNVKIIEIDCRPFEYASNGHTILDLTAGQTAPGGAPWRVLPAIGIEMTIKGLHSNGTEYVVKRIVHFRNQYPSQTL